MIRLSETLDGVNWFAVAYWSLGQESVADEFVRRAILGNPWRVLKVEVLP